MKAKTRIIIYSIILIILLGLFINQQYQNRGWSNFMPLRTNYYNCSNFDILSEEDLNISKGCGIPIGCIEDWSTKDYSKKLNTAIDRCICKNNESYYRICIEKIYVKKYEYDVPKTRKEVE